MTKLQNPLFVLGMGVMLGAGVVHACWLLRNGGKAAVSMVAQPVEIPLRASGHSRRPPSIGTSPGDKSVIRDKAVALAAADPMGAWRQSLEMPDFSERLAFLSGLMREWGGKDPAAALEMAGTLPAGLLKQEAFDAACSGWASRQPEAAAAWATSHLNGPLAGGTFSAIALEWASNDPTAAAEWVSTLPDGVLSEGATTVVINTWTEKDPQSVARWIDSFADAGRQMAALGNLAAKWCEQSPEDAATWVESRINKPNAGELAQALIGAWGAQDPQAAAQWVMTLHGELQGSTAATLLSLWAGSDPKVAADWAAQFPEGETRRQAIPSIASNWAGTEPERAVAWTLGLPDSNEQREALDNAVRTWSRIAPDNLCAWVDQQKPDEASDDVRFVAAGTLVESRPQEALSMAAKISDPQRRESSIASLLRRWGERDPAAARNWATQAGLVHSSGRNAGNLQQ